MLPLLMTIDDCSPLIQYEPPMAWEEGIGMEPQYKDGSYTLSWLPDSTASFSFNGTGFTIIGVKNSTAGDFTVSIDGVNQTGTAQNLSLNYQATLFETSNLDQGMHFVKFIKEGYQPVQLDYITWTSEMSSSTDDENDAEDDPPMSTKVQDTDPRFEYTPSDAWNMDPVNVDSFNNQSGHSTSMSEASVTFTFTGQAISLYGAIGPTQSSSYCISVDSGPLTWFNATRKWWNGGQLLYHADNLGPGEHRVIVTNGPNPDSGSNKRQATDVGSFDFDYAKVWMANLATTSSASPSASSGSPTPQPTNEPTSGGRLSSGAIAGISVASVVFLILIMVLWFLNKRNKTLWMRLQKGYMVQSQLDPHSSPRQNMSSILPTVSLPHSRHPRGELEPFPPGYAAATVPRQDAGEKYIPYAGFGRQPSTSKSSEHTLISSESSSKEGYQTNQGPTYGGEEPSRSGTLLTVSTLVAEAGTVDAEDMKAQRTNTLRRVGTPTQTNSTISTIHKSRQSIPVTPSSARSSRRRTKNYRNARSSSPSRDQLLGGNNEAAEEHESSDEDADFYASQASASLEAPLSPARSLAITQSEIQTPTARRLEEFPESLVRNDSAILHSRSEYEPHHQWSGDTLPEYSSKRTSFL